MPILHLPYELVGRGLLYKNFMNILRTIGHFFQVIDSNHSQISHFVCTIWIGWSRVTVQIFYEHENNLAFFPRKKFKLWKFWENECCKMRYLFSHAEGTKLVLCYDGNNSCLTKIWITVDSCNIKENYEFQDKIYFGIHCFPHWMN